MTGERYGISSMYHSNKTELAMDNEDAPQTSTPALHTFYTVVLFLSIPLLPTPTPPHPAPAQPMPAQPTCPTSGLPTHACPTHFSFHTCPLNFCHSALAHPMPAHPHLPTLGLRFCSSYQQHKDAGRGCTWIVKPISLNRGNGIEVCMQLWADAQDMMQDGNSLMKTRSSSVARPVDFVLLLRLSLVLKLFYRCLTSCQTSWRISRASVLEASGLFRNTWMRLPLCLEESSTYGAWAHGVHEVHET